jgi:hypothetical protein
MSMVLGVDLGPAVIGLLGVAVGGLVTAFTTMYVEGRREDSARADRGQLAHLARRQALGPAYDKTSALIEAFIIARLVEFDLHECTAQTRIDPERHRRHDADRARIGGC